MKQIIYLSILTLLISCGGQESNQKSNIKRCESLDCYANGTCEDNGKPFTGSCEAFQENGEYLNQMNFENGKIHGVCKYYYPDGTLEMEATFNMGIRNGVTKNYYPNGNLSSIENFVNEELQDSLFAYYMNGKLESKGIVVNGLKEGDWIIFDSLTTKPTEIAFFVKDDIVDLKSY